MGVVSSVRKVKIIAQLGYVFVGAVVLLWVGVGGFINQPQLTQAIWNNISPKLTAPFLVGLALWIWGGVKWDIWSIKPELIKKGGKHGR